MLFTVIEANVLIPQAYTAECPKGHPRTVFGNGLRPGDQVEAPCMVCEIVNRK